MIKRIVVTVLLIALIVCCMSIIFARRDGDANGDGRLNAVDVTMMRRHIIGTYDMTLWQIARADTNHNGRVDEIDIAAVRDRILGR